MGKLYTKEHEKEILRAALDHFQGVLPKLPMDRIKSFAELLNGTGINTAQGMKWKQSGMQAFLYSRRNRLTSMADNPNAEIRFRKKKRRRSSGGTSLKSLTEHALNGSGDLVRAVLNDPRLRSELKIEMLKSYFTATAGESQG